MTSSYTTNLGLQQPATGDQTNAWGTTVNTNWSIVDDAVAGLISINLPAQSGYPTVTLGFSQGMSTAQLPNRRLVFTGTLTANTLVLFPQGRNADFDVENNCTGSYAVTLGVNNGSGGALGQTTVVPQGATVSLYSDGTNVYPDIDCVPGQVGINRNPTTEQLEVAGAATAAGQAANLSSGPARASMDITSAGIARIGGVAGAGSNPTTQLLSGGAAVATLTTGGGLQVGSPTGGDQGAGAINAQAFYQNGAPVVAAVPTGTLLPFAGSSAPLGYLLADGSSYSTTTYAALFNVIGYTFGGSGSSFNVPDLRGRVAAGNDSATGRLNNSGQFTNAGPGSVGGEAAHTLVTGEMPSHSHGVNDSGHAHNQEPGTVVNNGGDSSPSGAVGSNGVSGGATEAATTGISIQSAGGGSAHNNVQPTLIVNYIIKT